MSKLAENIRYLRNKKGLSQQKLADELVITRGRYAKYEDGRSQPPIELLIKLSQLFKMSIDLLVTLDIEKYPAEDLIKLSGNRVLLPITVTTDGKNQIEIVTEKASMGYLNGYSDPEYIESLQTISLPFLRNGKFRAFPVSGDSMPPYNDHTFVVGKYMEDLSYLKTDKTYIFVTAEGITYKRFQFNETNYICVKADNSFYEPYQIPLADIKEIWEFACAISTEEFDPGDINIQNVKDLFLEIKGDLKKINTKMNKNS